MQVIDKRVAAIGVDERRRQDAAERMERARRASAAMRSGVEIEERGAWERARRQAEELAAAGLHTGQYV